MSSNPQIVWLVSLTLLLAGSQFGSAQFGGGGSSTATFGPGSILSQKEVARATALRRMHPLDQPWAKVNRNLHRGLPAKDQLTEFLRYAEARLNVPIPTWWAVSIERALFQSDSLMFQPHHPSWTRALNWPQLAHRNHWTLSPHPRWSVKLGEYQCEIPKENFSGIFSPLRSQSALIADGLIADGKNDLTSAGQDDSADRLYVAVRSPVPIPFYLVALDLRSEKVLWKNSVLTASEAGESPMHWGAHIHIAQIVIENRSSQGQPPYSVNSDVVHVFSGSWQHIAIDSFLARDGTRCGRFVGKYEQLPDRRSPSP